MDNILLLVFLIGTLFGVLITVCLQSSGIGDAFLLWLVEGLESMLDNKEENQ